MITKIVAFDKKVAFRFTKYYSHKVTNETMKTIASLGDFGMIWIAIIAICSLQNETWIVAQKMIFSLLAATLVGQVAIKSIVRRLRPCQEYPEVKILVPVPSDLSFPSGHTTSSFACAVTICYFYPVWGVLALIFAGLMGFSRIYLFVHYVSDVVFAMFLGSLVGIIVVSM